MTIMSYKESDRYYESRDLKAVLNIDTNEIVLIPINNIVVKEIAVITKHEEADLLTISNGSYSDLLDILELPKPCPDATKDFVIERFANNDVAELPIFTKHGYGLIYDLLPDIKGLSIKDIFEDLRFWLIDWNEDTPDDILDELEIEYNHLTQSERSTLAFDKLSNCDYFQTVESYDVDGRRLIIYSGGEASLALRVNS